MTGDVTAAPAPRRSGHSDGMGDRSEFEAAGIRHRDLYFDDCTVPEIGRAHV